MNNLTLLISLMALGGCSSPSVEESRLSDFSTSTNTIRIDERQHEGTWRLEARYPDDVEGSNGQVSGTTFDIGSGRNPVTEFPGELPCALLSTGTNSDYHSLSLPGGNGKYFNPCGLIVSVLKKWPYNGQDTSTHQHPLGGTVTVYYAGGNALRGFSIQGSQVGTVVLSINGGAPLLADNRTASVSPDNQISNLEPSVSFPGDALDPSQLVDSTAGL